MAVFFSAKADRNVATAAEHIARRYLSIDKSVPRFRGLTILINDFIRGSLILMRALITCRAGETGG